MSDLGSRHVCTIESSQPTNQRADGKKSGVNVEQKRRFSTHHGSFQERPDKMKVKIVFQMISHMFCFFWGWVKLILLEDRNDLTKDCANHNLSYCLWKKSCTSWYGKYPIIYRLLYIPSGCLGFLPSTVWLWIGWLPLWFPKTVDCQFSTQVFHPGTQTNPNCSPFAEIWEVTLCSPALRNESCTGAGDQRVPWH